MSSAISSSDLSSSAPAIERLLHIMARLRDKESGCPWDVQQSFKTIVPYTIEEAYEVADAIERDDMKDLKDELGDLLFQVVFYAQMAQEENLFDFNDIAAAVAEKMIRRHPHVFAGEKIDDAQDYSKSWEARKAQERASTGILDEVAATLPALTRAVKLQKRAAAVGFDWPDIAQVLDKIDEELAELRQELTRPAGDPRIEEELGDLLFSCANLARKLALDPERALRGCNAKFIKRFKAIEQGLAAIGKTPAEASLAEMEDLWQKAKG